MQSSLLILDTEAQQDEITAKATQLESIAERVEPGIQTSRFKASLPSPWTNH